MNKTYIEIQLKLRIKLQISWHLENKMITTGTILKSKETPALHSLFPYLLQYNMVNFSATEKRINSAIFFFASSNRNIHQWHLDFTDNVIKFKKSNKF